MISKHETNIPNMEQAAAFIAAIALQAHASAADCMMKELQGELSDAFDMAYKAGISTFRISNKKTTHNYTAEEYSVHLFIELLQYNSLLLTYSGIFSISKNGQDHNSYYYIPALYRISDMLPQIRIAEDTAEKEMTPTMKLELTREAAAVFLKTMPEKTINGVVSSFQRGTKSRVFFQMEAFWQGANYLNDRKAKLFILYAVTNLFWNLLYPVDPTTGLPFSIVHIPTQVDH